MYQPYKANGGVATIALCPKCRREIPAIVRLDDDNLRGTGFSIPSIWMDKHCPICGETSVILEKDAMFYHRIAAMSHIPNPLVNSYYYVDITRRCNLSCDNCYVDIDNASKDPSVDEIMADVRTSPCNHILLCGGEPTVREDLPEIIARVRADSREVSIMTNGLRLGNFNYVKSLADAGLNLVSMSIHQTDRERAVGNCRNAGLPVIGNFTITSLEEIPEVIKNAEFLKFPQIRIRSAFKIGKCAAKERIFLSDMSRALVSAGCELDDAGHHFHFVSTTCGNMRVFGFVIPDVETINLGDTNFIPRMRAKDGVVRHVSHSFIVNEKVKDAGIQLQVR